MNRKWLPASIIGVVLMTLVPLVSAYEAHIINVKATIKQPTIVTKTARLATHTVGDVIGEIEQNWAKIDNTTEKEQWQANCSVYGTGVCTVLLTDPFNVPMETLVVWVVRITITNPESYNLTEVVVTDNFSAELAGQPLASVPVDIDPILHTRGKSTKKIFPTQYRLTWYVTYVSGDVEDNDPPVVNSGLLLPGETEWVDILVWTKNNPALKQEYTTPGPYEFNSGPVMKAVNTLTGHQWAFGGDPLGLTVFAQP